MTEVTLKSMHFSGEFVVLHYAELRWEEESKVLRANSKFREDLRLQERHEGTKSKQKVKQCNTRNFKANKSGKKSVFCKEIIASDFQQSKTISVAKAVVLYWLRVRVCDCSKTKTCKIYIYVESTTDFQRKETKVFEYMLSHAAQY